MTKIFIDGHEGTTGLKIHERLQGRTDIQLLQIADEKRKDIQARKQLLNEADIAILCLPDDAAREAVKMVSNSRTRIIDASTAHRTMAGWVYGLPELSKEQRQLIKNSSRVAIPGCHATGCILALAPLVKQGIVGASYPLCIFSITGYSGGGKKMIASYEQSAPLTAAMAAPRPYALTLTHKHLPEIQKWIGLARPPFFMPVVSNYYQGMAVSIPLNIDLLSKKLDCQQIQSALAHYYSNEPFIRVFPPKPTDYLDNGFLTVTDCNNTNMLDILVFGNQENILIITRFDNLGKGASGTAVQCLNIMLGRDETTGLK